MNGILFIFGACFLWAVDTLIRYPLMGKGYSAGVIVGIEHLLLVICFLPFYFGQRKKIGELKLSTLGSFLIVGGLGSALATLAFTSALGMINPSVVMLLQKLQPIFAIILAHFVLKETIRKNFVFWAFLAMIGAGLVGHREFLSAIDYIMNSSNGGNSVGAKGIILTLIAAGGWGASTVFGKVLSNKGVTEWGIIAGRYLFGGLILAPIMFSPTNNVSNVELEVWGKILVMAILSGIIAMYLYYTGLKKLSARVATLAELFFPFSAVVVNWIFLGATLNLIQVLGGLLLIISSGVIQWKKY